MKMLARAAMGLLALLLCSPATAATYASSMTSAGVSPGILVTKDFNFSLWGTFSATCELDRSFDSGTTWLPLTALGTALTWTGPATEILTEPEAGVLYRVNCTTVGSGTVNYRVSQ
jgi:hypothetical protein